MSTVNVNVNAKADEIVILTKRELEDVLEEMAFKAATSACSNLYDGLSKRFLYQLEDRVSAILQELEDMNR